MHAIVYDIEKFIKTCEFDHFISSLCRNDIEMYRKLRLKAEFLVCTQNLSLLDVSVSVFEWVRYRVPDNTREKTIPQRRDLATY